MALIAFTRQKSRKKRNLKCLFLAVERRALAHQKKDYFSLFNYDIAFLLSPLFYSQLAFFYVLCIMVIMASLLIAKLKCWSFAASGKLQKSSINSKNNKENGKLYRLCCDFFMW